VLSLWYWVVDHFVATLTAMFVVVLACAIVFLASGVWLTPVDPASQASTTTTTLDPPPASVALDTSPASSVVSALVASLHHETGYTASDLSSSTNDPLLAGCASDTIPAAQITRSLTLSTSTSSSYSPFDVVAEIDVYGAGLGGLVVANTLSSISSCAGDYVETTYTTGFSGFIASGVDVSGSSILDVTLRRGDVVVSLYAFPTDYESASTEVSALASAINLQLTPTLATTCPNENAPATASSRNPTQSDYRPYTAATEVVTPPVQIARPNLDLVYGTPPVVSPPPAGSVTTEPSPPAVPTVALSITLRVPAPDTVGPGCGWAFTAMVPPAAPTTSGSFETEKAAAITKLESAWVQWPAVAAAYLQAEAHYVSDLASYDATISTTTTTTTTTPPTATTTTTTTPATPTTTTTTVTTPTPLG
jgi:hypothetical protein